MSRSSPSRTALTWLAVLVVAWLVAPPAWAQPGSSQEVWQQANVAYQEGHWEAAATGYRALAARGVDDADVWYNLGNAYVHLDDAGRARVCYERALILKPRDGDVLANRAHLTAGLADQGPPDSLPLQWATLFTRNELALMESGLWFCTALLGALWIKRRRPALAWLTAGSCALLLGIAGLYVLRCQYDAPGRRAVVIPAQVKLFTGPGRDSTVSADVPAGTQVQVLRTADDWREVRTLGVTGWVRSEQLESVR